MGRAVSAFKDAIGAIVNRSLPQRACAEFIRLLILGFRLIRVWTEEPSKRCAVG